MDTVQPQRITVEQIGFKYGLMLAGANTGFFLLMALFGWEDEIWLRFVNLVFIFLFAYRGMQHFKHHTLRHWTYLKGLSLGMFIVLVGSLIFAVFLGVYGLLNQQFVSTINEATNISINFNPVFIAFVAFFETMIYGFILVFTAMQRLKTTHMQDSVHI
jgi:phosphoglycerol transferase MdoB-like AlkP superfamily enzyme